MHHEKRRSKPPRRGRPGETIESLMLALEKIEVKAQAGLCYFTLASAREFLKDIRDEVSDALGAERPKR